MNIKDYRDTLDKISCTESFKKNLEKQLSAPPQNDDTTEDDAFVRFTGRGFGRYAAIAASLVLIAATGALFYRIKNMPPDDVYPGTEFAEPTNETTEKPTKGATYAPENLIPGNSMTDSLDASWTEAVYIPAAPANEDKAVTFNMTDVQALLDAVAECSFVWSDENRFTDPRREEFMVGSLEIYTEGYIQEVYSSDSRLKRVAEGDWDKVVSILREQLHADKSVEEDVLALETAQNIEANDETRDALADAARSNPNKGTVSGTELTRVLNGKSCLALYLPIGATQDDNVIQFNMNKQQELKEAINECSFVWNDTDQFNELGSEAYCLSSLYIYPEGYIQDRSSPGSKPLKVTFGDWDKVTEILHHQLSNDTIAMAEYALIKPEKEFTSMSADITADLKSGSFELYNISGSGKMYFIDNTMSDSQYDKEYIYIDDPAVGYTGELTTVDIPGGDIEYYYTEHTQKNRIDKFAGNWAVHQDENGFTAFTNGSRFFNTPTLEYRNIRRMICQHLDDLRNENIDNLKTSIEKIRGVTSFRASYTTLTGVNVSITLVIDAYGTPVYWEEYGVKRLLLYQLQNVTYNESFEMPEPVLTRFE